MELRDLGVPTKCGAVRICGPIKAALCLVESGPQIVAVVSVIAGSQQDARASGLHTGNDRYIQYAVGIWRIYSGPVGFCISSAGPLDLANPLFYRCLWIYCGSTANPWIDLADLPRVRWILQIYCGPDRLRGSTVGQLDQVADPLFYMCLRINCGPVGPLFYMCLWIYCGPFD